MNLANPPLPPGPRGRKLHNIRQRLSRHSDFMDELHAEYGDIAFFEIPARKCGAVFSAELIHEVLVEQEPYFQPYYPTTSYNLIPSPCLATSRFETHTQLEQVMSTAFAPERMPAYQQAIITNAATFCERVGSSRSVDLKYEAERYTWGSLLDAVIGVDLKVEPELGKSVLDAMKKDMLLSLLPGGLLLKRLPLPHNIRTARQIEALDEQTYRSIARARDSGHEGEDVISHFVRAHDLGIVDWSFPDDSEIRDEAYTLMFGAVDAPTGTLTHGIYYLARNPVSRQRLEQEVDDVLNGRPVTPADLDRLPFARAVFKETLRLEPPAYVLIPRETLEDRVVGGYLVPKGTLMNVCMRVMQRRADYWSNADDFRPERWLEDGEQRASRCPAHSYLPFSIEPRICQGKDFAEALFVSGLASLSQQFRLEPESKQPPTKTNIGVGTMGTYSVYVTRRSRAVVREERAPTHSSDEGPPGPPRRPLQTVREMAKGLTGFYESLHQQYGDIVAFDTPGARNWVVFSSELLREVLEEKEHILPPAYPVSPFDVMKSPGLARSTGEDHRRLAELFVTAFAGDRMQVHADMLAQQTEAYMDTFRTGQAMDLRYEFERLAWNGVFRALFGTDEPPDPEIARPILKTVKLKFVVASMPAGRGLLRLPLPFLVSALRAAKKLDPFVYEAIRRASDPDHPGHDVVSHFVNATRRGLVDWSFKNEREIRDEAYTMLFAAYEAPVMVLVYSAYYLARNPAVRKRLEQEVDEVLGNRPLRGSDFGELRYAQAVCRELLRVQPPATALVPRIALEDSVLGGYRIPRGTVVQVGVNVLHSRRDYWGDDAAKFRPERWLPDTDDGASGCPEHAFVPFSREPRACRGADLATMLMVFTLVAVARRFRLNPVEDEPPDRLSTGVGFFSGPALANVEDRTLDTSRN